MKDISIYGDLVAEASSKCMEKTSQTGNPGKPCPKKMGQENSLNSATTIKQN